MGTNDAAAATAPSSGHRRDHHIPNRTLGEWNSRWAHVPLVHVIDIPEFGIGAVTEIAEDENAGPPIEDGHHVAKAAPSAAIVRADLLPQAEVLFEKPSHLVHRQQVEARARRRGDGRELASVASRPDYASGDAQGVADLDGARVPGVLSMNAFSAPVRGALDMRLSGYPNLRISEAWRTSLSPAVFVLYIIVPSWMPGCKRKVGVAAGATLEHNNSYRTHPERPQIVHLTCDTRYLRHPRLSDGSRGGVRILVGPRGDPKVSRSIFGWILRV